MKARHALMATGIAIAGWLAIFGDKTPNGEVAEPVARINPATSRTTKSPEAGNATQSRQSAQVAVSDTASSAGTNVRQGKLKPEPAILALLAREELMGGDHDMGKGGALFTSQSWLPPPPPPPKPVAPPPPTAPAVPFTYIGKKLEDTVWEVYLTKGEQTYIVREKSVIEANYRIESIKPPTLTLNYLPLNQMQTLPIGGAE